MKTIIGLTMALALAAAASLDAQEPAQSRTLPPVQRITTASAVSSERLGAVSQVRELPDGSLLVNDFMRRRLLLLDTGMNVVRVVLDSTSEVAHTYGTRPGAILPFRGDTTLFIDPAAYAIVVLDPLANIVRVRSVWRVQDLPFISVTGGYFGTPGLDARGRIVYRINAQPAPPAVAPPPGVPYFPPDPDSAFIVAVDIDSRKQDTVGVVRVPKTVNVVRRSGEGYWYIDQQINPLPTTDDWTVLPDGTIAFVRGIDYRIEYLHPDGSKSSTPKLPFEWTRLSEDDKARIADSTRTSMQKQLTTSYVNSVIRWVNQYGRDYPANFKVPDGFGLTPGLPKDWLLPPGVKFPPNYIYACAPGVQPPANPGAIITAALTGLLPPQSASTDKAATPGGAAPTRPAEPPCLPAPVSFSMGGMVPPLPQPRQASVLPPAELPDYRPPFPAGSARADFDGNVWIRTNPATPISGGPVYDVISSAGQVVSRMQLPSNYSLLGFGRGRVVYLSMRDPTGLHVARVRLK